MASQHPLNKALGEVVRELRTELGLSQERVGDVHRNVISKVERSQLSPTVLQLERIARGLGTTASDLLARAERRAGGQ